jgi:AraC-like DNA-binding protein
LQAAIGGTFSVRSLADAVNVHPSHLCRAFHRFRGRTIGDYVMGLRMQLACRRIVETEWPLSDVAAEAGFADHSHLTRVFRRFIGQTPSAYRKRIRLGFSPSVSAARDNDTNSHSSVNERSFDDTDSL